jgi:hypothetical protein
MTTLRDCEARSAAAILVFVRPQMDGFVPRKDKTGRNHTAGCCDGSGLRLSGIRRLFAAVAGGMMLPQLAQSLHIWPTCRL